MSVAAIIITKDAEDRIERTLKSVSFADEKIVVLDESTQDTTAEIAKRCGASVFSNPWQGYGPQKNFGLSQATSDWVLFVDDDEEIPESLQNQIKEVISNRHDSSKNIYWLRIVTVFLGKPLNHLFGHNPRLFRRTRAQWTNSHVHEQLQEPDGSSVQFGDQKHGLLTEPLLHHSHSTIRSYLTKMHRYTTLDAKQMQETSKHRSGKPVSPSIFLPYRLAGKQFLKLLLYRRGVLDGVAGWIWCSLSAYYEFEMAQKFIALRKASV